MIVAFDATTIDARMSGVGYYTARLLESLANGAGEGTVDRLVVLSNREVPLVGGDRVQLYQRRRFAVRSVWMQLVLPGILREVRPDVAHFTNYLAPLFAGCPYVVSVHDMSLSLLPSCHTLKKRLLTAGLVPPVARGARLILVPSESTRGDVVRLLGVDAGRVRVIPYAPAPHFQPAEDGQEALVARGIDWPYFLYVGTVEPRKNLARALRAFARIAPAVPDHRFLIVGQQGWKCAEVLAAANRKELAGRVVFAGYRPESELPLLYTHAQAFVYPSLYEGFGLPVVEAMACGSPVLTSATSSLAEIADGAARLVHPEDEIGLSESLLALATDAGLRARLRARGLERARSYSWDRTGRQTVEAYREAAAARSPSA
jgi:glycosyltransferase involved in cell wall biosynthesis